MTTADGDSLVKVYEANNAMEAQMLHQRLAEEGINAYVEQTPSPLDGLTAINEGTEVQVRAADAVRAIHIVERFLAEREEQ